MITLCMDTSHIFLSLGLIEEEHVLCSVQMPCWKRQSEEIFPQLIDMMDSQSLKPEDIDAVVISEGPGSYTGVRIAMTIAKVMCAMKEIPLYTIGTLQLYAGMKTCRVVLDARSKRVYTGKFENGLPVEDIAVRPIDELNLSEDELVIGDGHLVGRDDVYPDLTMCFLELRDQWKKAENVHLVTPEYLKSASSYLVKK